MSPTKKTPAEQAAQKKYMAGKATIQLVMTPEEREAIKAHAADLGMSTNAYVMDTVKKDIEHGKKVCK
jgi:predicted HicB family RNase H-like nuclease